VTGRQQELRKNSVGAGYGGALPAARLVADPSIDAWNPVREVVRPDRATRDLHEATTQFQRQPCTADVVHALAACQHR
jgi:xylulokinase